MDAPNATFGRISRSSGLLAVPASATIPGYSSQVEAIMPHLLYLWREERDTQLSPSEVQRRLDADEDIEGLADLPIKEMIDRLKREFSGCKEVAGQLTWNSGNERFRATWTWQHMRLESDHLSDEHRDRFFELARSIGCPVFDPQLNLKMS
jgi:hypothetical protein